MRKIIFLTFLFIASSLATLYAQTPGLDLPSVGNPTSASIPSFTKSPVSLSTGIPEVRIPLLTIPNHSKSVDVNVGLIYHPANSQRYSRATDVGLGWSSYGVNNVIYREILNNAPTNVYYYNFFGNSGKFLLTKNSSNVYLLTKITLNKFDITFSQVEDGFDFIIKDENATSYYFQTRDKSFYGENYQKKNYTSSYHLSKVIDKNNIEVLNFEYTNDTYIDNPQYYPVEVIVLKLDKIISQNFGIIKFNYNITTSFRKSYNDQFELQSIELKNPIGKIVKKYAFEYGGLYLNYPLPNSYLSTLCTEDVLSKRTLIKIKDFDKSNSFQTTDLFYNHELFSSYWTETLAPGINCFENEAENPKYLAKGLLSSIKYPTGNETKYTYEPNQYFYDNAINFPPEKYELTNRDVQTYEDVATINFDVQDGNSLGLFTIANNPDETDGASYLVYNVHVAEYYPLGPIYPQNHEPFINFEFTSGVADNGHVKFLPGQNGYKFSGTGGKGILTVKRIRYKAVPVPNFKTGNGVRIKQIDFYDNNVLIPALSKKYSYIPFDNSSITSGIDGLSDEGGSIIYKNVKETNGDAIGYSKYYFKTFEDFPENLDANGKLTDTIKFYNVLVNGVLAKVEIFDNSNNKITEETNDFEFKELPGSYTFNDFLNISRRNAIIKKLTNTSTLYNPSGLTTQISETTRDQKDFNVTYKKSIGADGNITEQLTTFPWQYYFTNPRLWNAKLTSIPLITESKINGVTVSKSETKYEDVNNFYPTSQYSYTPDNLTQGVKNVSYDIYDDKGNLVQFTTFPEVGGVGKSTTVIWGYHKTMPIAKIEGVKLSNIPAGLITSIINASDADADATTNTESAKEKLLIDALNNFRSDAAMKKYMVSCFTYNPLIGITNTISANGMMESYVYDAYNRLQTVKDVDGNIIKTYQYNYKH